MSAELPDLEPTIKDLEQLIRSNPTVDTDELERRRRLLRQMREGRAQRKYRLASPVNRRRAVAGEAPTSDPRTVQLRTRKQ